MNTYKIGDEMEINVTQKDIEEGRRCSAFDCPIARAAKRHTGLEAVVTDDVELTGPHLFSRWYLPLKATDFIQAFDARKPVSPLSFRILCYS